MSICLIDTSILCGLLEIPDRCQNAGEVAAELRRKIERDETLLLPMSAIVETGNHIGQIRDGRVRRSIAEKFVRLIQQAIRGEAPFIATPSFERASWNGWMSFRTGRCAAPGSPT